MNADDLFIGAVAGAVLMAIITAVLFELFGY